MPPQSPRSSVRRSPAIPPFLLAAHICAFLAFSVGWLGGGRVERFGVAVLICDYAMTSLTSGTAVENEVGVTSAGVIMLVFTSLAFRSDRWWPFVAAAALMLCVMVSVLEQLDSGLSRYAVRSAQMGLWIVIYLSVIAGVAERWLAGDRPGQGSAVRVRRRATS